MSANNTPRADAVLKNLSKERQHEIWLRRTEGPEAERSLAALCQWLREDGIKATPRMLSEFLSWYGARQDLQETGDLLETFEEFTRKRNPDWSAEKVRDVAVQFFMAHTAAKRDVNKFVSIATLDQNERFGRTKAKLDERKVSVAEGRLALLKQKAAQADQAKGILGDQALTEDQKRQRMLQLFGMGS